MHARHAWTASATLSFVTGNKKTPATLDEKTKPLAPVEKKVVAVEEQAPTKYVKPYRDHGVESPMPRPPSVSQLAAQAAPTTAEPDGVRGRLVQADFNEGEFILRLADASASMRALAQLFAAQGLEVEIVVRRRTP